MWNPVTSASAGGDPPASASSVRDEAIAFGLYRRVLLFEPREPAVRFAGRQQRQRTVYRLGQHGRRDHVVEQRLDEHRVGALHRHVGSVRTDGPPALVVARAAVEECARRAVVTGADPERTLTAVAGREVRQQVRRRVRECRPAEGLPGGALEVERPRRREARMGGVPLVCRDDGKRWRRDVNPLGFRSGRLMLLAPAVPLSRRIPDRVSAVLPAEQNVTDRRRRPGLRAGWRRRDSRSGTSRAGRGRRRCRRASPGQQPGARSSAG